MSWRNFLTSLILTHREIPVEYRFPGYLSIHYHQSGCRQKEKNNEASIISVAIRKRWSMFFTATGILSI